MVTAGRVGQAVKWAGIAQDSYDVLSNSASAVMSAREGNYGAAAMHLGFAALGGVGVSGGLLAKRGCFTGDTPVVMSVLDPTDMALAAIGALNENVSRDSAQLQLTQRDTSDLMITTRPIKSVALGMRVVTDNPQPWNVDLEFDEPVQETWRLIRAVVIHGDGGLVEIELLRPRYWIEEQGLESGQSIYLHLEELNVDGIANVMSIEACPPIESGEGRVVLGRFISHAVDNMLTLRLSDGTSLDVTSVHLFWSDTQQAWIEAGELEVGEELNTLHGPVTVVDKLERAPEPTVYNLETHCDHIYRVANIGVLVHNTYLDPPSGTVHPSFPHSIQIKYGEGLSGIAKAHRISNNVSTSKNIAVIAYIENGVTKTKLFESKHLNGAKLHSEDLAAIWIKANKVDPTSVTHLYSEFHPCASR